MKNDLIVDRIADPSNAVVLGILEERLPSEPCKMQWIRYQAIEKGEHIRGSERTSVGIITEPGKMDQTHAENTIPVKLLVMNCSPKYEDVQGAVACLIAASQSGKRESIQQF